MREANRWHISVVAVLGCAAILGGCTSSGGADDPTVRQPSATGATTAGEAAGPTAGKAAGPTTSAVAHRSSTTVAGSSHPSSRVAGRFTIAFAGDVHFSGRIGKRLAANPATVFAQAAPGLARADLTMVNLETAITTRGQQQNKLFTFRAPPTAFTALRDAGVDLATMANNHGADYGASGLRDSIAASRAKHFPVVGIGSNAKAAFAPYTTTLNGVKIAIFAADQVQDETTLRLFSAGAHKAGVANAYSPTLIRAVRAAKRNGYVVITYIHWGIEYQTCPSTAQSSLAAQLAAAGASAVIGTHAHVLQGAGWRSNGTYVAYGLGNYLWWRSFGNNQDDNGVLTLSFDHQMVTSSHFAPSRLDNRGVPVPATGAEKKRIAAELATGRACTNLSAHAPR